MIFALSLTSTTLVALLALVARSNLFGFGLPAILALMALCVPIVFAGLFPNLVSEGFDLNFSKVRVFVAAICFSIPLGLVLGLV